MNYRKKLLILIGVSAALRLLFNSATELGADEAYYWTYALKLQWNYFDHPPIVAWLIRLTTINLWLHNEFAVRVGAVICCAICNWLIFNIATVISSARAGWFAALLYNACIYCSITAGSNILPDSPQMVFWLIAVLTLIKITQLATDSGRAVLLWCFFGLSAGLCTMCKVHGLFLWLGALLYVMLLNRAWLKHRGVYLAAIITLVTILPIIIWNIQNGFISYKFHSNRISPAGQHVDMLRFMKAILEQISICNPVNFFLIVSSLFWIFKKTGPAEKNTTKVMLYFSLPLIAIVLLISLFNETFPHWAGPAYSCLLIVPAVKLACIPKYEIRTPNVLKWALGYMVFVALSQIVVINYFPGTLSKQKEEPKMGLDDLTLQSYGWKAVGRSFGSLYHSDVSKKLMPLEAPIIITNWDSAAAIEFYVTHETGQEVLGIGNISDLHQYFWTNSDKKPLKKGDDAYFIAPSETFSYRTTNLVFSRFAGNQIATVFYQYRSGLPCRTFSVFRLTNYIGR